MVVNNLKKFDSSTDYVTLLESIDHFQNNTLSLNNFETRINFNNQFYTVDENLLYTYKGYLSQFVIQIDCPERFYYHPEWVAKILYGSIDLWFLIMWYNPIASFDEFNLKKILVFDPNKIEVINKIMNDYKREMILNNKNPPLVEKHTLYPIKIRDRRII